MSARKDEARGQSGLQGADGKDDTPNATPLATSHELFGQADRVAASIPFLVTRERKRSTIRLLLNTWLAALEAGCVAMAGG